MNCDGFKTFGVRIENAVAWVTFDYPPVNIQGLPMLADLNSLAQKLEAEKNRALDPAATKPSPYPNRPVTLLSLA
jgi:hypothetical protein